MIALFYFIGALLFLTGLVMVFLRFSSTTILYQNEDPNLPGYTQRGSKVGEVHTQKAPPLMLFLKRMNKLFMVLGLGLFIAGAALLYSRPGHQYYVLSPFGQETVITNNGYKFIMPLSRVQEWEKYFDIKTVREGEDIAGIEGVIPGGIPIRFIDKVTGNLEIAVRIEIPSDPDSFIKLVKEFRHPQNLINNTLIPTIREQVINTAYMFSAENYVSGDASNFRVTLDDQLKNGGFAVDKMEKTDTIKTAIQVEGEREITEIKTYYEIEKRLDGNGVPIRIEHDIKKNNVIVSQVIVEAIDLEPKFKTKLETQRDLSAERGIQIQKIGVAQAAQKAIVAEGERDKAQERVTQEKAQVGVLIEIETDLKKEETNRKLAKIQLETEKLNAAAVKVAADAESYKNRKLVVAGLTPQEKVEMEIQMNKDKWENIKAMKLPEIYITGGDSKGGNDLLQSLIGADLAKGMKSKNK